MSQSIGMLDIPFAPILGDTIPPTIAPRDPLPVARPKRHSVVAWRNEGGLDHASFETLERAIEHANGLLYVIYYKWTIQCGRDFVARGNVSPTADDIAQQVAFAAWYERQQGARS